MALIACGCSSPYDDITPEFKQNPQPKQRYQLTLTIANAPGPFASVQGFMQFDVDTPECLPPPNANGGHLWPTPTETIPFAWTRVSDTEYTGVVYIDGMVDEDYYGRGLCRWKMMQARAALKATGAARETRFVPNIYSDKLAAQQAESTYLLKADYPRHPEAASEDPVNYGLTDRTKMAHLQDSELFVVTLTPKLAAP
ncbi:hypothetical protein [Pseudomonas sp. CGJS7]|uniref:hypothetical protein n=1 Tax=Pseudomonas sp. CGJS7 TaxID=3109348 RepID=UPI00300ADF42